jgi:hypothetical protein
MTDFPAQPIRVDLNNLAAAKQIIRSIQRDCRATLKLLAVLEELSSDDKESNNVT